MCGIVGYIGQRQAYPFLLKGLSRLEYRGYDSCGIATSHKGEIKFVKDIGKLDNLQKRCSPDALKGSMGIAHTRWATHGVPSKENAHPHLDCNEKIAVVHNGIISNYLGLKKDLQKRGHEFKSGTDTEVIAHLIEEYYEDSLEDAVVKAIKNLEGTYAIIAINTKENKIVCARKENPLVLGLNGNEHFVGSDISSFLEFTNTAIPLDDHEIAVLTPDSYEIFDAKTRKPKKKEVLKTDWGTDTLEKQGFDHFMLKEIDEQPVTIKTAMEIHEDKIKDTAKLIMDSSRVYIVGTGTSLHAAMIAEYWFAQLAGVHADAIDSSEFSSKGVVDKGAIVISITQSGETYDTLKAMRFAKSRSAKIISIVNVIGSSATRESDLTISQGSGFENAVCSTKTFTAQLMVLLRLALGVAKAKGKNFASLEKEMKKIPGFVKKIIDEKEKIKETADKHFTVKNYFFIGRGINYATALEGALKLKEISYLHAEGMSGGILKHGTISLIDKDFHTVAFVPLHDRKILTNIEEIKARNGFVVGISSGATQHCHAEIVVPEVSDELSPFLFSVAAQLLAYFVALKLGNDIDRPRSLAKSVTVE